MKKFRFLLIVAIVLVSALALCLTASASEAVTVDTYDQVYVGEYNDSTDLDSNGQAYSGEAYIVFGKVTGTTKAGVLVKRYAVDDSAYATVLETKYYPAREGKIADNGEYAIALFKVQDGYYKAQMVAGDPENPTALGDEVAFSKGVASYTVTFYKLDGTTDKEVYTVPAGGTVVPPEFTRDGFQLTGWTFSSKNASTGKYDSGFRDGGWGNTYEKAPSAFVVGQDRVYAAVWKYVGENGDAKAPEVFNLKTVGYNYVTANSASGLSASGAVGVMSFDVLEDGVCGSVGTTWLGTCSPTSPPPYNYYTLANWLLYNDNGTTIKHYHTARDTSNVIRSTANVYNYTNIMKAGNSVQIVYSPYRSAEKPGWLRAYIKGANDADYVLYAGYENLTSAQAPATTMPCFGTLSSIQVPLENLKWGIDTDGDYTTLETEHGMSAFATATSSPTTDRYVIVDNTYCKAEDVTYNIHVPKNTVQSVQSFAVTDGNVVSASNMNTANGSKFVMQYTIDETNIASAPAGVEFGFGMNAYQTLQANWWSGTYGLFMSLGGADAKTPKLYGPGSCVDVITSEVGTATASMRTMLARGNTVKVEMSFSTNSSVADGYIRFYYKKAGDADFTLGAQMESINTFPMLTGLNKGGYPFFGAYYWSKCGTYEYDAKISNFSCNTYDSEGNVLSSHSTLKAGTGFNSGYTTNWSTVTKFNPKLSHTVTFVDGEGNVLDVQTVSEGSAIIANLDKMQKAGYDFVGFAEDVSYVTSDVTLTAQYEKADAYYIQMASQEQSSSQAVLMSNAFISSTDIAVEEGEYLEIRYTVSESNVGEQTYSSKPTFGFGFCHAATMNTNFSGRHGYGVTLGWDDGAVTAFGGSSSGFANSAELTTTSYDVPMKTLLTKGTQVKVIIALDTTDDEVDTGYAHIYYKTEAMSEFALAGSMTKVGISDIGKAVKGGYPMFFVGAINSTDTWRLEADFTDVTIKAYDSKGNAIATAEAQTGSSFSAAPNKVTKFDASATHTVNFVGPNGEILNTQTVLDGHDAVVPSDMLFDSVAGYAWGGLDVDTTAITADTDVTSTWTATETYQVAQFDTNTANDNSLVMSATGFDRNNLNADQGETFVMRFTVLESNVADCKGAPVFGFGFAHHAMIPNNWSGTHGWGATFDWTTGVPVFDAGNSGPDANGYVATTSNGIGMKDVLTAGSQVMAVMAYDLTADTVDTGYVALYYKTAEMSDYVLVGKLSDMSQTHTLCSNGGLVTHYPAFFGQSNVSGWKLNMKIADLSFATYSNGTRTAIATTPITDSSDNGVGNTVTLL